jgi:hypothetical protein
VKCGAVWNCSENLPARSGSAGRASNAWRVLRRSFWTLALGFIDGIWRTIAIAADAQQRQRAELRGLPRAKLLHRSHLRPPPPLSQKALARPYLTEFPGRTAFLRSAALHGTARAYFTSAFTTRMPKPVFLLVSKSEGRPTPSSQTESRTVPPKSSHAYIRICLFCCVADQLGDESWVSRREQGLGRY